MSQEFYRAVDSSALDCSSSSSISPSPGVVFAVTPVSAISASAENTEGIGIVDGGHVCRMRMAECRHRVAILEPVPDRWERPRRTGETEESENESHRFEG